MYSIFSKKIYTVFIRVIAGLAILILIFSILNNLFIYKSVNENNLLHLVFLITGDVIAIIPCILIVLKPKYDYLISIVAFFYSIFISFLQPNNAMGIDMFILGVTVLVATKRLSRKHHYKIVILCIVFLAETLFAIRFGAVIFISSIQLRLGHIFILFLIIYFIVLFEKNKNDSEIVLKKEEIIIKEENDQKILNLAQFSELHQSDVSLLEYLQQGKNYGEIAEKINSSEGYMKNQFTKIYKILSVENKKDFLRKYNSVKIIYEDIKTSK